MSQNPGNFSYCFPADLNNLIITGKNPKKGPNRGLFFVRSQTLEIRYFRLTIKTGTDLLETRCILDMMF